MSNATKLPASDAPKRICCDCLLPDGLRCHDRTVTIEPGKARCIECHAEALAHDLADFAVKSDATKVQHESSGWSIDTELRPLPPMVAHEGREPVPAWWKAVEAHLDEEAFYTAEEIAALGAQS